MAPLRIYVAAPLPLLSQAREVSGMLRERGHAVVSTWHEGSPTVALEAVLSDKDRLEIAITCQNEISSCDALVLLYGPRTERHGSVAEAAFAAGLWRPVYAVAVTEDAVFPTLVLQGLVAHVPSQDRLVRALQQIAPTPGASSAIAERAATVDWIRSYASRLPAHKQLAISHIADEIERGSHLTSTK